MDKLNQLIANFKKINVNTLGKLSFEDGTLEMKIMNAQRDLIQDTGIDMKGNRLRTDLSGNKKFGGRKNHYAKNTERRKEKLSGIPAIIEHVTLTNEGDFWKSQKFTTFATGFKIDANFKKDGKDISENFSKMYPEDKDFQNAILGINDLIQNDIIIPFLKVDGLKNIKTILEL
jgi:hypothetical protein